MASIIKRLQQFAASPQGRKLIHEAKRAAQDPHKRRQAQQALRKLRGKR